MERYFFRSYGLVSDATLCYAFGEFGFALGKVYTTEREDKKPRVLRNGDVALLFFFYPSLDSDKPDPWEGENDGTF